MNMGKKSREKKFRKDRMVSMQEQQSHRNSVIEVNQEFSGPIPPPNLLNQYEQIVAGAADRLPLELLVARISFH